VAGGASQQLGECAKKENNQPDVAVRVAARGSGSSQGL